MSISAYADLFSDLASASRHVDHYEGLSDEQRQAVRARHTGLIVVSACPGSGKTRVLTERVQDLLRAGVPSGEILVCTFTRSAATELKDRLARTSNSAECVAIGTLHGHAWRLTGGRSAHAGKSLMSEDDLPWVAQALRDAMPAFEGLSDRELVRQAELSRERMDNPELGELFSQVLASANLLDFSFILESLKGNVRRRYRHVLVDEAQDLSALQLDLVRELTHPKGGSLFLCGDDDQSLYGFRGTQAGLLADLARTPGCLHLSLSKNYRSTSIVVSHANAVIRNNKHRLPLVINPHRQDTGEVGARVFQTQDQEIQACHDWLLGCQNAVVLGRTREVLEPFAQSGLATATIHESKGREWNSVWLTGLELGRLPHVLGNMEEERRLMYVGMTRARDRLFMASAHFRNTDRELRPSDFLFEAGGF